MACFAVSQDVGITASILRGHSMTPCKLLEVPRRIRVAKTSHVLHARTWCLVTALWEESGKVGFDAAVLSLKSSNHFSSIWQKSSRFCRFELKSDVSLVIPPWWFHAQVTSECFIEKMQPEAADVACGELQLTVTN